MLTTPVTTPSFHSRVLSLLASHNAFSDSDQNEQPPFPLVPPLTPLDTFLSPNEFLTQLPVMIAPWIDLASPDPLIAHISRQVFKLEIAYAAFCGAATVVVQGPRLNAGGVDEPVIAQYARSVLEALNLGPYLNISILLPMVGGEDEVETEPIGSLASFTRKDPAQTHRPPTSDEHWSWDVWNVIRNVCNYHARLSVGSCWTLFLNTPSTLSNVERSITVDMVMIAPRIETEC